MISRVPMVAAVAFAVLSVLAIVVVPPAPGVSATGAEVVEHLVAHSGMIRLQALLTALALLALAVVVGHARDRLDGPAGHIFTVGAAVLIAQVGVRTWIGAGLALHAGDLDPGTARLLGDIAAMWRPLLTVSALLLAGPVIWAARGGRFPRWLAVVAAVFAVEQGVELLTIIGPVGSFIAPSGPMNVYLGGALFLGFLFALGMASALPEGEPAPPPDPVAIPDPQPQAH